MSKIRVLIADKLSNVGLDWLKKQADVEIDIKPGLPPAELAKIVGGYDAMIIRSGVKVTAEVLENPGNLKIVARAGGQLQVDAAAEGMEIVLNRKPRAGASSV